jgi:type II secretory pathway component GspD/PulD (secretin)
MNPSQDIVSGRSALFGAAKRVASCVAMFVVLTQLTACQKKAAEPQGKERLVPIGAEGEMQPMVLSSKPAQDTAAFNEADRQLTPADYELMEKLGPKPLWEKIGDKKRSPPKKGRGDAAAGTSSALNPGAPSARPEIDPDNLPADIVELPGDRVRIIWSLRSFGGTNVVAKPNGNTSRREVTITPPDLEPLVKVLTQYAGEGAVILPLAKENTLVITCKNDMRDGVLELLSTLDVPARQVEITAKIFEVSHDFDFQQGAQLLLDRIASDNSQQLASTFSTPRFLESISQSTPYQGSVVSLMKAFQDAGINVEASFQMLAETGMIRVVSSPRMTVAAGQTGYMLAGQELPIQSANITNNVLQTTTTYKPVGVQLYITPQSVSADQVKLHTISIVSSVSGFTQLPSLTGSNDARGMVNPIIDSREAETAVTIDMGNTLVISGLRMIRVTTRENKVPGLGDVPVLGWLFKNHRSQQQMTDLYFFVTPTLL